MNRLLLCGILLGGAVMLGCNVAPPTGSCTDQLELALRPTRSANVFQVDICGRDPNNSCLQRSVELVVDNELRGTFQHGDAVELWCYCGIPYTVYARDLACVSPPVRIFVETGDGDPNGAACVNLPVGQTQCNP